ncbi:uncharacterized protein LOC142817568 [Rhipicephalus microplus]|uniref:uncharacterized protein LOC142817568 n=1 Tax=Rhipicephalus microplus TaxID=6941 RepID=UPI003F6D1B99
MAAHAGPPGFDEEADNWEAYRLRLEAYFEVHDVTDEKKRRAILVTALSTKTVDLLAARCAPVKIQDLKYEDAVKFLGERFAPACNEIAKSYKFFTRNQLAGESVNEFLVEIRKIASRCNFGSALDRMLGDRIVCGLRDASVRRQLLAKAELALREAEEAARAAEMTAANVDHMASAQNTDNGQLNISVTYGGTTLDATLVVLGCSGPDLCGRDVIKALEQHGRQVLAVGMKAAPASAPAIFQRRMEAILQGIPGVQVYLDDVVVAEKRENCKKLREVFQRLRDYGVKLHPSKCKIRKKEVEYLGHRICADGLLPKTENIEAVSGMFRPTCVAELRSFIGFVTYYHAFLGNLSTVLAPLYELLKKNARWQWGARQEAAFEATKRLVKGAKFLTHYDPQKPLMLETNASSYGIGAVLYHRVYGEAKPVGFRSRTLTAAERNYAQIEREALAVVYGVTKFREYLLGNTFTLITDHKTLLRLLSPDKPVPALAAARIQRWSLLYSGYTYTIEYKAGKTLPVADALSRLPASYQHDASTMESINNDAHTEHPGTTRQVGESVWYRNYGTGARWKAGVVQTPEGHRMVTIKAADGEHHRRHYDQLRGRETDSTRLAAGGAEVKQEPGVEAPQTEAGKTGAPLTSREPQSPVRKVLCQGDLKVKDRRYLVVDLGRQDVRVKLYWLLHYTADEEVCSALNP